MVRTILSAAHHFLDVLLFGDRLMFFFLYLGSSAHRDLRTFVQILPFFYYGPADGEGTPELKPIQSSTKVEGTQRERARYVRDPPTPLSDPSPTAI